MCVNFMRAHTHTHIKLNQVEDEQICSAMSWTLREEVKLQMQLKGTEAGKYCCIF